MVPHKTPVLFQYLWPKSLWHMPRADKVIYLTFDDGPIPELTDWVLSTLSDFGAKATFFCVGENVEKNPEVFKRIIANGHRVGNHTHNHLNGQNELTASYLRNVILCDDAFYKHDLRTDLFRPPYGRLKISQRQQLKNKKIVMWDVLTKDYDQSLDSEVILEKSIKATQPGSVIVFHDNLKAEENLKTVLPRYLTFFRDKGFEFKAL